MSTTTTAPLGRIYRDKPYLARVRYRRTVRTISRWHKAGLLPPPDTVINGREHWTDETLDAADAARKPKDSVT
jgi:hypothetical protein